MSTFVQMQSTIADDLNRSDLTSQIKTAINRAITHYESEVFWFQQTTGTFSTIANQQSYGTADGLPSDIKEINEPVKITVSSTFLPALKRISYAELIEKDIGAFATTQPDEWAWYNNKMWLYPRPNTVLTVTIPYQKSYTALSADADTNDWTTYAEDLIESRAKRWIYSRLLQDDKQAAIAKADEMDALSALQEKTTKLISTGYIKPTSF
jgi:hypothetical protein